MGLKVRRLPGGRDRVWDKVGGATALECGGLGPQSRGGAAPWVPKGDACLLHRRLLEGLTPCE